MNLCKNSLNPSKMETNELPEGKFSIEHDDKVNVLEEYFWRIYSPPIIGDGAITERCIAKVYDESTAIHIVKLLNQERLALQSKDEEINRISENFAALQVRLGEECTKSNALEEQLKAKDEVIEFLRRDVEGLIKRCNDLSISDMGKLNQIDSLTSENNELKKRLSEIEKPT